MRCAPSSDSGEAARQSRSTPAETARLPGEKLARPANPTTAVRWASASGQAVADLGLANSPLVMQPHVLAFPLLERLQQRLERDALEDSPDLAVARANRVDQRAAVAVIARLRGRSRDSEYRLA